MSNFTGDLIRIPCGKDKKEWVEVINSLTDEEFGEYNKELKETGDDTFKQVKSTRKFLKTVLKAWNFCDNKGEPVPMTPENIDRLTLNALLSLAQDIQALYAPEKKSSEPSQTQS